MTIPQPYKTESRSSYMTRCTTQLMTDGVPSSESVRICDSKYPVEELTPTEFVLGGVLLDQIYKGVISERNLPTYLYEFHYLNIQSGIKFGYGLPIQFAEESLQYKTALAFRKNISFFSGAKTFQQTSMLSSLVFNDDGTKRKFADFKSKALTINRAYNTDWLRTEQNSAFAIAQSAESWENIVNASDVLPLLKYVTVGDGRVRPEHASWDGIIKPVNDDFWNTHFPPNDWNCRCIVSQLQDGTITNLNKHLANFNNREPKERQVRTLRNTSKVFANNAGKSGVIFGEGHSYFEIPSEYKKSALKNFGFVEPSDEDVIKFSKKIV